MCADFIEDEDMSEEELMKISQKRKIPASVQRSGTKRDRKVAESDGDITSTQEENDNSYTLAQIKPSYGTLRGSG